MLKLGAVSNVSLTKIIQQVPDYAPGACQLFSNATVGPDDTANFDVLKKFITDNPNPNLALQKKGILPVAHPDEFRRKIVPGSPSAPQTRIAC